MSLTIWEFKDGNDKLHLKIGCVIAFVYQYITSNKSLYFDEKVGQALNSYKCKIISKSFKIRLQNYSTDRRVLTEIIFNSAMKKKKRKNFRSTLTKQKNIDTNKKMHLTTSLFLD